MQRYFANINKEQKVELSKTDEHHISHVMRMKKGDEIEVVSEGKVFLCRIDDFNPLSISVVHELSYDVELKEDITLIYALTKGDTVDLVLQKATELGVKNIVLFTSERTVVKYAEKDVEKKCLRFHKIMKEASEQSHRVIVPNLLGIYGLNNLPKEAFSQLNYVAYEKDAESVSAMFDGFSKDKSISILIGPEGGLSINEINLLTAQGFKRTSLGKRILRAETAAIYALSVIGYLLEK